MLAAWRRTPVTMNVPERTAHMLSEAAVSITITSLTDIVSLFIGNNSPFPAIKIFSIYTGMLNAVHKIIYFCVNQRMDAHKKQPNAANPKPSREIIVTNIIL